MKELHAKCDFKSGNWSVNGVHCRIAFPGDLRNPPTISVRLTESQFERVSKQNSEFTLSSSIIDDGGQNVEIIGENCWLIEKRKTFWPHGLTTCEGSILLDELTIITTYESDSIDQSEPERVYKLTSNGWAQPWHSMTKSYTGEVEIDRAPLLSILDSGTTFELDTRYDYVRNSDRNSYEAIETLVVRRLRNAGTKFRSIRSHDYTTVDDICKLVQLASRSYVTCVGNDEYCSNYTRQHFRINHNRSTVTTQDQGRFSHLIDRKHVQPFLKGGMSALRTSADWTERIRSVIAALVPPSPRTIEGGFIAHFSALEELIEHFTVDQDNKHILGGRAFRRLCSEIKDVLKRSIDNAEARARIERQLPALNNVPLQDRFEAFCRAHAIQHQDLWPAFSGTPTSLYKIRNRLVHSRALSREELGPVCYAADALQALLERSVLALLKWPASESDVAPATYAHKYIAGRDMKKYVAELEQVWNVR
jgi:hypothetical protein